MRLNTSCGIRKRRSNSFPLLRGRKVLNYHSSIHFLLWNSRFQTINCSFEVSAFSFLAPSSRSPHLVILPRGFSCCVLIILNMGLTFDMSSYSTKFTPSSKIDDRLDRSFWMEKGRGEMFHYVHVCDFEPSCWVGMFSVLLVVWTGACVGMCSLRQFFLGSSHANLRVAKEPNFDWTTTSQSDSGLSVLQRRRWPHDWRRC